MLIAAAGIWMSVSGEPAMAAPKSTAKTGVSAADRPMVLSKFKKRRAHAAKKSRTAQGRHARKAASKVSSKSAAKPVAKPVAKSATKTADKIVARKPAAKQPRADEKIAAEPVKNELSPKVANARAQALADDQARNISALDSTDVVVPIQDADGDPSVPAISAQADAGTASAQDAMPPAAPVIAAPAAPVSNGQIIRAVSSSEKPVFKTNDSDPWSQTSLIGKIFIAFGSLLTLASAARLIIA